MIIRAKRIYNVSRYLGSITIGKLVVVSVPLSRATGLLTKLGFPNSAEEGLALVPPPVFGAISRFNANGTNRIHHDLPFETVYRSVYSTWQDWNGDSHSGYVNRPYKRRPRTFVPPPAIELKIAYLMTGEKMIITPKAVYGGENSDNLKHQINLMLEIFGECEILTENLDRIIAAPVRRLNWRILPPGVRPFEKLRDEIRPILGQARRGEQPIISKRLEVINSYEPTFVAVGEAGFTGYVVFGFPSRGLFLFESMFFGNATYVFGDNWQRLSQLSKGEILDQNLAIGRVVHREQWVNEMHRLLSRKIVPAAPTLTLTGT